MKERTRKLAGNRRRMSKWIIQRKRTSFTYAILINRQFSTKFNDKRRLDAHNDDGRKYLSENMVNHKSQSTVNGTRHTIHGYHYYTLITPVSPLNLSIHHLISTFLLTSDSRRWSTSRRPITSTNGVEGAGARAAASVREQPAMLAQE